MVEVVTREEFDEFKKSTKKRLDDILKALDETRTIIDKRMDEVEDKSKSIFTRIKEAIEPVPE